MCSISMGALSVMSLKCYAPLWCQPHESPTQSGAQPRSSPQGSFEWSQMTQYPLCIWQMDCLARLLSVPLLRPLLLLPLLWLHMKR